ncbi:MAG: Xaa-Pro peptidase family protein [Devosia sp.]
MSRFDFTRAEFGERHARLVSAMHAGKLDWLVVIHPASIHWLTGSEAKSYQEFQCLLFGADEGAAAIFARAGEVNELEADALVARVVGWGGGIAEDPIAALAPLVAQLGLIGRRIGLEVVGYYLHPYHYQALLDLFGRDCVVDASAVVGDAKLVKSPAEVAYIREAAAFADQGMAEFRHRLREGVSELELAGQVMGSLLVNGSGIAASPINLVSGPRSAFSHGAPTPRRLAMGDAGNIEFGATSHRYTSTIGRQFSVGPPSARARDLYDIVRRASDEMIAEIADGVPAIHIHEIACAVIADAGLDAFRVHLSGYSLGPSFAPSWAEPLHMLNGSRYVLQAGMVVTIEPPVFIGGENLGARIIDNVLVTESGAELLARDPRELIVAD